MTDYPVNSYRVTFEDDLTFIETTVFAMSPEAAEPMALDAIIETLHLSPHVVDRLYCVNVELIDKDVL